MFALLAQNLSCKKYEVHLGLITDASWNPGDFPPEVTVHCLNASRVRSGVIGLVRLVRRIKPAVIVSGMFHLNFLVLLLRPLFPRPVRVIVRQNGTVSSSLGSGGLPAYTRTLYRLLYRRADRVICQSVAMAGDLALEVGLPPNLLAVLSNPVEPERPRARLPNGVHLWTGTGPHLLAIGRLSQEKGFDVLLDALAILRNRVPGIDLVIAGSGPQEMALKKQSSDLGLDSVVRFAGHVAETWAYFEGAWAFVLPSRHEGMPNALLEAAVAGLPIVATPASQGLTDLLEGQPGTWLVPETSSDALADTLFQAIREMGQQKRFMHKFMEPFQLKRAISAYEDLIDLELQENAR